jgi:hypothetical protein
MTEKEWLNCTDPRRMLEFLQGRTSDRKLRLCAVAYCRRIWSLLNDERSRRAVEVAERLADGGPSDYELMLACDAAEKVTRTSTGSAAHAPRAAAFAAAPWADSAARGVLTMTPPLLGEPVSGELRCELIRHIVGNPFRTVAISPTCLTPTVTKMAVAIYEERVFDRLPILADALEEAGCTEPAMLEHLRGPGPHVRGCWVVDVVLGKE